MAYGIILIDWVIPSYWDITQNLTIVVHNSIFYRGVQKMLENTTKNQERSEDKI